MGERIRRTEEEYISGLPRFADHSSIEILREALSLLGHPEKKLRFIHVAGTNGKGSVVKMLDSILGAMGFRVGRFISPHLIRMNERIAISDVQISDSDFSKYSQTVRSFCEEHSMPQLCFFEFFFLMAVLYFSDEEPDYVILETGLGGTLDATTAVFPILNIITAIGMDHMQILGDTIERIAAEKAGIITSDVPVIYNTGSKNADGVIEQKIRSMNVENAVNAGESKIQILNICNGFIDFSVTNAYYSYNSLQIHSMGIYQTENAATVLAAVHMLKRMAEEGSDPRLQDVWNMSRESLEKRIQEAMKAFSWEARMEFIRPNFCVDGAHNENAVKYFIQSVKNILKSGSWSKVHLFFAAAKDKDYRNVLQPVLETIHPDVLWLTEIESERRLSLEQLYESATEMQGIEGTEVRLCQSVPSGLEQINKEISDYEDTIVFAVGSLYLAGEIKQYFTDNKR